MKAIRMLFVIAVAVALGSTTRAQIDFAGAGGHARAQAFISPQLSTVDTNSEENSLRLTANKAVTNDQTIANGTSVVIGDANATGASLTVTASGNTLCRGTRTGNPDVDRLTQGMAEASYSVAFSATQRCSYALSATVKYSSTDIASDPSLFNNAAGVFLSFAGTNIFISVSDAGGERTKTLTSRGFIPANAFTRLGALGETRDMSAPVASSATSWSVTLTVVASPELPGTDIHWTDTSGGSFGDTANWLPTQIPVKNDTEADTAIFDKGTSFTVDLSLPPPAAAQQFAALASASDPTVERIVVSHAAPIITGGTLTADALDVDEPSLIVEDGGFLTLVNCTLQCRHGAIGDGAGGGVKVLGIGNLTSSGQLTIGTSGRGELDITRGGTVSNATVLIGGGTGPGIVQVSESGSRWDTANIAVGFSSSASLTVSLGAVVNSDTAVIGKGLNPTGTSEALVTGPGSIWNCSHELIVGEAGVGSLDVEDGGLVKAQLGFLTLRLGVGSLGVGTVNVSGGSATAGTQSQLSTAGIVVGENGGGLLNISNGGVVFDLAGLNIASIGGSAGSHGEVIVQGFDPITGKAASLSTPVVLVGETGRGKLAVFGGAQVTLTDTDLVAQVGGPSQLSTTYGEIDISGSGNGRSSTLIAHQLTIGPGNASLFLGSGGRLEVDELTVTGQGVALGFGVVLTSDFTTSGTFSPGASPGTFTVDGNFTQIDPGVTIIEVAGTTTDLVDHVIITGNATLGGTLRLQFMNGFAPKTGNVFNFLNVTGAISNDFTTVDVEGLAPGAQFTIGFNNGVYSATALNDATPLQTVSIKGGKTAKEKKGKLKFTISRAGSKADLANPVTVNYRVGGTAENGIDYALLPGSVTIPARKKSVKLTVPVINDLDLEGPETVELTILPGSDYTHSLLNKASMTILDDD
jgi:T5SS/PEP-CTERM-associated repeat protein